MGVEKFWVPKFWVLKKVVDKNIFWGEKSLSNFVGQDNLDTKKLFDQQILLVIIGHLGHLGHPW